MINQQTSEQEEKDKVEKIQSLQEMISTAEKTIFSAQKMLEQIKKGGNPDIEKARPTIKNGSDDNSEKTILGTFDGQIMIGEDGKQYPVPANYASKSKLVENDMLKLTITPDGRFVYKQIGPADRKYLIGLVKKDERGNFIIKTEEKTYKVLLAAATYFKIEEGDEVTIIVPKKEESVWSAVENIVRKGDEFTNFSAQKSAEKVRKFKEKFYELDLENEDEDYQPSAVDRLKKEMEEERKGSNNYSILDEWTPDLEDMKKETKSGK